MRAPDQLHDIVQLPAHHVDQFLVGTLADGRDPVIRLNAPVDGGRAARDHVQHLDVVVLQLQRRADALVRQAHLDAVFLGLARRQVAGMRVQRASERVHKGFEHVIAVELVHAFQQAFVTLLQDL